MKRTWSSSLLWASLSIGCGVSNTGKPNAMRGSAPEGVELVRSTLSRDEHPALSAAESDVFESDSRAFAFALYAQLKSTQGNLFFSPYSVATALAMTYAGAKSDTKQEMSAALHLSLPEPALHVAFNATDLELQGRAHELVSSDSRGDGFQLQLTNAAFAQKDQAFVPAYLDVLAQNYGAGMFRADFAGNPDGERQAINRWVSDRTEQRIEQLLPSGSISPDVALVLVNAIYFKAPWLLVFDPSKTVKATFHGQTSNSPSKMMHGSAEQYVRGANYQALELPFLSNAVSMLFVLPDDGAFDAVEQAFDDALLSLIRRGLSRWSVAVQLPRFTFRSASTLSDALRALGMKLAFGPSADFSGIGGVPGDLSIAEIYHQGFIAVDEHGAEAAGATGALVSEASLPPPAEFIADRPFLFLIYDAPTGQVLFAGRFVQPEG